VGAGILMDHHARQRHTFTFDAVLTGLEPATLNQPYQLNTV
jgi:hypothetical protein